MNDSIILKSKIWLSLLVFGLFINTASANSTLSTDLQNLLADTENLNALMVNMSITDANQCDDLFTLHKSVESLIGRIELINSDITSPLSIDNDSLLAIDNLSTVITSMAAKSVNLSLDLPMLNSTTEMFEFSRVLTTVLRLADDIGTMADRILEMSDKILVMADNIGLMADRIIITQQIQSDNLALTQTSILITQQNALSLISVVNTNNYSADINAQTFAGNIFSIDIAATVLSRWNMAREWSEIVTDSEALLAQVKTTYAEIKSASESNTLYIDIDSYTALADMSIMVNSIGIATQGLALASQGLSPVTSDSTLTASMQSILQMSSDISVMANRILEMADLILAMADNIGLTADQIIATQQLQSLNYAATLASVTATQEVAVAVIAANSL